MSQSFEFTDPDLFTAGAVGRPGQRTFYLQAREHGVVVTLKAEKEQVRALGEYLAGLLAKLPPVEEPAPADLALCEPLTPAWAVGAIGVAYDQEADRILLVVEELVEEDEEDQAEEEPEEGEDPSAGPQARDPGASPAHDAGGEAGEPEAEAGDEAGEAAPGASARFRVTRAQGRAFAARAEALVAAGRPACRVCGGPIDPDGHVCPRSNGHVRH